jgi:hypothetical protein
MEKGGKRPGAGRRAGSRNKKTLEKAAVMEAFNQRVMNAADRLFNAQLQLAVGSMKVFRIDEVKTGNLVKRNHVQVTDVHEIKALLDEHEGNNGEVDDKYYYFTDVPPDNRALDSLLNRTLGKPKETVEHSGTVMQPVADALTRLEKSLLKVYDGDSNSTKG